MNEIAAPRDAAAGIDIYDVEERLSLAETRYARARSCLARIRAEYETLALTTKVAPETLAIVRERLATAIARCNRAHREIEEMERQLE